MRSGRLVPRRRAGRAARFADEAGTRSAKEMGVPGNRMPRMLEKAGAHRSRARFAASVAAWNGLFPVAVFPCGDCGACRGIPVPAESRRGFAGMRREPGREAETGREGICRPPSRGRDGQRRFGRCVRPGGWNRRGCGVTGASSVLLVHAQHAFGLGDLVRRVVEDVAAFQQARGVDAVVEPPAAVWTSFRLRYRTACRRP